MGAFNPTPIQPQAPAPVMAAPPRPTSDRLAGKSNLASPTPEQMANGVKTEVDSLKQLVQGFARQYPQAGEAAKTAIDAIQAMGDSVTATLEPPLGSPIDLPPSV